MIADPYYPVTSLVVKESMTKVPLVRQLLQTWGAVAVARDRRDISAIRRIFQVFRSGRGICIAAQGTRSRTGRLGPMNGVLMRIAIDAAAKGVPVFPVVEIGTYEALPPGAWLPRPHPIRVVSGGCLDFSRWIGRKLSDDDVTAVAQYVQSKLAELLPPERQPAPGTPPVTWDLLEPDPKESRPLASR
jgi:1-acyl-sn-glycerol-3-phosphate acyltransferase